MTTWYDETRVRQPGSVILQAWMAAGGAKAPRVPAPRADTSWGGVDWNDWVRAGLSSAGVSVNEQTAMAVSAVYACVALIAGAIASLPVPIYKRTANGDRERVDRHPVWWFLNEHTQSAAEQGTTAATMWEYLLTSRLLYGDAFARIDRPSPFSPEVRGLTPWHPLQVEVRQVGGLLKYLLTDADGRVETVRPEDILHITGLGFDGLRSQSVLRHALRNPAGIAWAADEYSGRFFQNGARPDFALTMPGSPSPDQLSTLRSSWGERYGGVSKSHLPAVLTGGMDVKQLTMSAEDTQLIETRQFQVEDIARVFGVPPFMIGHTEKTTSWGSGVEQMSIGFVKYTLQRHLTKFEQEINRKFWRRDTGYFAEFAVEGLLRGDSKTRSEFYRSALGGSAGPAWMTTNEVRRIENLPPVDGADTLTEWKASDGKSEPAAAARA